MDKPILFSSPMVKALLENRKTQTRRIMKPQPILENGLWRWQPKKGYDICLSSMPDLAIPLAKYQVGDHLWVRETWYSDSRMNGKVIYKADNPNYPHSWKPSIFMPRWASRITLEVTEVRVQRLNEISEEDAKVEGASLDTWFQPTKNEDDDYTLKLDVPKTAYDVGCYRNGFANIWQKINGKTYPWSENCYVWAYTFKKLEEVK